MTAAYSNPLESKSENSTSTRHTLDLMREALHPFPVPQLTASDLRELAEFTNDLGALCAEGMIQEFVDANGVTRYRPTNGRIA